MIHTKRFLLLGYEILLAVSLFILCAIPTDSDLSGGTNTGDGQVIGYIYYQVGPNLKPAANATVTFIISDANPDSANAVTAHTDEKGLYKVQKSKPLPLGEYNIFAEKDNRKAYKKNGLTIEDTASTDTVPPITLSGLGSLTGVVLLQPQHTNDKVIILLIGTNLYFRPDTNGVFTLDSMAPGDYPVHIIAEPDGYTPLDTVFTIREGIADTLTDTLRLPYNLIPVVKGFKIDYDTTLMLAKLSWKASDNDIVKGYSIYRAKKGQVLERLNDDIHNDTFYVDDVIDNNNDTLTYGVVAADANQNEGDFSVLIDIYAIDNLKIADKIYINDMMFPTMDIFYDKYSDRIYACKYYKIFRFNKDGTGFESFGVDSGDTNALFEYIHTIQTDKYQNIYVYDWEKIVKLDSSFAFIAKLSTSDSTTYNGDFTVSPEGDVFTVVNFDMNKSRIRKYNSSLSLLNTWEIPDMVCDIQVFNDTLILNCHIDPNGYHRHVIKFMDLDFTLLDIIEVPQMMVSLTGINSDTSTAYYWKCNNGHSIFYQWHPGPWGDDSNKVFIISPNRTLKARALLPIDKLITDTSQNFYQVINGYLYIYHFLKN